VVSCKIRSIRLLRSHLILCAKWENTK